MPPRKRTTAKRSSYQSSAEKDQQNQAEEPSEDREQEPQGEPPEVNQSTGSSPDDDQIVTVPFGDNASDTATLLLAAAEEQGDQSVVRTGSGVFYVPAGIAKKAGVEVSKDD